MLLRTARLVAAALGVVGGLAAVEYGLLPLVRLVHVPLDQSLTLAALAGIPLLTGVAAYAGTPRALAAARQAAAWLEARVRRVPTADLLVGTLGLLLGLLVANLLAGPLGRIPAVGPLLPVLAGLLAGYLGWVVAVSRRDDLLRLVGLGPNPAGGRGGPRATGDRQDVASPKILDTSAIIDGRIAEVCAAGFLEGRLIVPAFVLEELRHIADSTDPLRRNRGRRGLEVLQAIQQQGRLPVEIYEGDEGSGLDVDSRLVAVARALGGKIVTTDLNLNKVAQLQGVGVLNVNELANALKPVVLPGEELEVQLIREGKESGQGVGYLDDGTMVVVEGGKRHIGETLTVVVTSVLQTHAGRMIFGRPKPAEPRQRAL